MSIAQDLARHYAEVRNRLRRPPNAVPDTEINLRRRKEPPPPIEPPEPLVSKPELPPIPQSQLEAYEVSFCRKDVTFKNILKITAEEFGLKYKELFKKSRQQRYVLPRQISFYVSNRYAGHSLSSMGRLFGLDHTSVMHGRDKIIALLDKARPMVERDHWVCERIKAIEDKIFETFHRHPNSSLNESPVADITRSCSQVTAIFPVDNSNGSASDVSEARTIPDVVWELCSATTNSVPIPETAEGHRQPDEGSVGLLHPDRTD